MDKSPGRKCSSACCNILKHSNLYVIRRRFSQHLCWWHKTFWCKPFHFCCCRNPLKGLARVKHKNCRCSENQCLILQTWAEVTGNPQYWFLFYIDACLNILQVVSLLSLVFVCSPWINFLCLCVNFLICKALLNTISSFLRGTGAV